MITRAIGLGSAVASVVLCAAELFADSGSTRDKGRVQQIIDNVRANELLYENIDVHLVEHYEIIGRKAFVAKIEGNAGHEYATTDKDVSYVSQNGMFRVDVDGKSTTADHTLSEDRIRMFDGHTTRLLDQNRIGNIIGGRKNDYNFVRPHMLLTRSSVAMIPLSMFLQKGELATPAANDRHADVTVQITYEGEGAFQGLRCHKLWITYIVTSEKAATDRWELWLAEDRNYLLVRMFAYTFLWSPTIAIGEGSVSQFREIEPGIWFPVAATSVHYDGMTLQRERRQKPSWRRTYEIKSVSLNPNYDISYFRDLTFPPGTTIYEVEHGKILKSYVTGRIGNTNQVKSWWWILGLNLAVLLAVVAAVYLRRRRKQREA